jgi:hypothetical protein
MSFSRFVVVGAVLATLAATGCSTGEKDEPSATTTESELKLSGTRYLGQILSGETRTAQYAKSPLYRSYAFDAKGGDEVTVDIDSHDGDPIGWITDANYTVLATNDDANANTLASKVKYKVPATQAAKSYRIVFRDYDQLEAEFDVTLTVKSFAPPTCSYGNQTYRVGDTFKSTDGCNGCSCTSTGTVSCTKNACACNPLKEPERSYRGTPQQCMVMRYSCPAGQQAFSNACGCGCESAKQ